MDGELMVGFGGKQAWLAVRAAEPAAVRERLGLRDLGPVPWRDGVDLAYLTDDRLVLTPQLRGAGDACWTLVAGRWLLRAPVDVAGLSATLDTEVQFFATYRVGEVHRWRRAVRGDLVRAFGYVGRTGEVTEWFGAPDSAERAVGLPPTVDPEVGLLVSEADVLRLAAVWSVDPSGLDGRTANGSLQAAAVS